MSKARKRPPKGKGPKTWNVSEILYAFVGMLTNRKSPLIFSASSNCAPIAELVAVFIKENNLPAPRDGYPKVKWPSGTDHLTNVPSTTNTMSFQPLTAHDALEEIKKAFNRVVGIDQRDAVIARFFEYQKNSRANRSRDMKQISDLAQSDFLNALKSEETLENIARGGYSIIEIEKPG